MSQFAWKYYPKVTVKYAFINRTNVKLGEFIHIPDLIRELDPISCNVGSSEFKNIYEELFKTLELNDSVKSRFVTVLDFWREIRNLVHNNFVYFSRKGEDLEILYRGQVYNFKNGEQVPFLSWKLLLLLTCDSADMFKEILNLEKIKEIPRIIDPANIH